MSLRFKLFGAIVVTMCLVLALLVALLLIGERDARAARLAGVASLRGATLRLAANVLMHVQPEGVRDTWLMRPDGTLLPEIRSLAVYRPRQGAVLEDLMRKGAVAVDDAAADRALVLVRQVLDGGAPAGEGDSIAVPMAEPEDPAGPAVALSEDPAGPAVPPAEEPAGPAVAFIELAPASDDDPVNASRIGYLVVVGAGLFLLVVTWGILDRFVARPLSEVARGAKRVAVGDYGTPVPHSGGDDEIQRVVAAFNSMMLEIGTMQGRMRERTQEALLTAKKTQDSLVIAQRLASTGRLAAGIAHEVNNPLAGMLNAVHSLRTKDMAPAKRDEYLEIVEDGLRRVQATVAKILQFTPHKVAPRPVDVGDVVRPVLALARHRIEKEQVEAVASAPDEPAVVFGDPYELQQALLNVVLNALDALEEAHRETPRIEVTTSVTDDEVRLLVRDNGVGMKEEDVPRAFDLFFTTKEPGKGTGLGLATAHKIIIDHGGRMELRSRGAEGMDVEFVLPRFRG